MLVLANSEKKLQEDNENLKKLNLEQSNLLEQKNCQIEKLTHQVKNSVAKFNGFADSLPDVSLIENLTSAVKETRREIKHSHILNYLNYTVVALCLAVVVSIGYQTYVVKTDIHSIQTSVKNIQKGIYNSKGWSVLEGSQNNEWVFSQEHPALYQLIGKILKNKKLHFWLCVGGAFLLFKTNSEC